MLTVVRKSLIISATIFAITAAVVATIGMLTNTFIIELFITLIIIASLNIISWTLTLTWNKTFLDRIIATVGTLSAVVVATYRIFDLWWAETMSTIVNIIPVHVFNTFDIIAATSLVLILLRNAEETPLLKKLKMLGTAAALTYATYSVVVLWGQNFFTPIMLPFNNNSYNMWDVLSTFFGVTIFGFLLTVGVVNFSVKRKKQP